VRPFYSQNTENPPEKKNTSSKKNTFLVSFDERVSQFLDFSFLFSQKSGSSSTGKEKKFKFYYLFSARRRKII
jgi:hypothetical protein